MPDLAPDSAVHFFVDSIRKAASEVLSQALASPWDVVLPSDSAVQKEATVACFGLTITGQIRGSIAILVPTAGALLLAQKFLGESPEASAELTADRKEALEELLRQIVGLATTTLRSRFGDVQLVLAPADPPTWQGQTVRLLASEASTAQVSVTVRLSPELLACLASPSPIADAPQLQSSTGVGADEPVDTLSRLSGVKVKLSLRFGRSCLTLRELMQLSSGSVVELDRRVHEPVDLLLDNRLLARGDVVVIEGNYGIRITDLATTSPTSATS